MKMVAVIYTLIILISLRKVKLKQVLRYQLKLGSHNGDK